MNEEGGWVVKGDRNWRRPLKEIFCKTRIYLGCLEARSFHQEGTSPKGYRRLGGADVSVRFELPRLTFSAPSFGLGAELGAKSYPTFFHMQNPGRGDFPVARVSRESGFGAP